MGKRLTDKVTWTGKVDWELTKFHGNEYSTKKGSSYNSYLIKDEKTVLIDTVWLPFDKEFVEKLRQEIDLDKIDYIVINHAEIDHSGALGELMRHIPDTPIYCTANGVKSIKGQFHQDWNFVAVKTGDTLDFGENKLIFVEAPMLHWPDTMFSYMTGENILFSTDAFGQHYATESLYNDKVDKNELYKEAVKYYANILAPFSKMVMAKLKEVSALNLQIDMICPSHGVIWKNDPMQIVDQYSVWADNYAEDQITIVYDTMWNSTRIMAENIAAGIKIADKNVVVKLMNSAKRDKNDIITEIFKSKTVIIGSSTINNGYLFSIGGMLEMIKGMKFKNKKAAVFGSYGWSGEACKLMAEEMKKGGFEIIGEPLRLQWKPDQQGKEACVSFGKQIAETYK